ncbi:hypothetical protein [Magnetovibrio blakemorei]|uniref:Magnetosome protein MamD n=3 Tax=Pseudomonadota TaxID=1224 RepID=A0A1E5QCE9_9PROT|nr:hypothetical protein [Magnetovibrio blakemorei]ASN76813.1 iron binding protein [Vibrio sp. MV-1]OEJ69728.1 hypothetical protein BEN30_00045 [Magnetovibrio blakemorei]
MYLLKMTKASGIPSTLTGKTFTVGQVTTTGNGAGKWLLLQPKGVGAASAAKGSVILKMEGNRQLMALVGKTVTVGKAPVMGAGAGAGKWLALHPVATATKGAFAGGSGVSAILTAAKAPAVASTATTVTKVAAGSAVATKTSAVAGTIWSGTGLSLGLGLGLGALGPALLAGGVAAGGYYLYNRSKNSATTDEDLQNELAGALA